MNPFHNDPSRTVASIHEGALLHHIRTWLGDSAPPSPHGMGDDVAVLPARSDPANLITVDTLVYQRHFDESLAPAEAGAKLLKRNLSDLAAMGGTPLDAVTALFLPSNTRLDWLECFTRGLAACAVEWGVAVAGGDLTETDDCLGAALTLTGHAPDPLLRTGSVPGDRIWVTGALGGSIFGGHARFTPRLREGWFLTEWRPWLHAVIDLSDGLGKDLPAILPSGAAARINLDAIPISPDAHRRARSSGRPPLHHAFTDGEDYELLFTTDRELDPDTFKKAWRTRFPDLAIDCIGEITAGESTGAMLNAETGEPLEGLSGYEHFRGTP